MSDHEHKDSGLHKLGEKVKDKAEELAARAQKEVDKLAHHKEMKEQPAHREAEASARDNERRVDR